MLEVLLVYCGFALTTALTAMYELLNPVIVARKLAKLPVENEFLLYFTFLIVAFLGAPLVFLSCLIPSWGERFRNALSDSMF